MCGLLSDPARCAGLLNNVLSGLQAIASETRREMWQVCQCCRSRFKYYSAKCLTAEQLTRDVLSLAAKHGKAFFLFDLGCADGHVMKLECFASALRMIARRAMRQEAVEE